MEIYDNDKDELLEEIMSLKFSINDLVLYLDTHPNDEKSIKLHNDYSKKVKLLTEKYQEEYGPLNVLYDNETDKWEWIKSSWPWEGSGF